MTNTSLRTDSGFLEHMGLEAIISLLEGISIGL